MFFYFVFSKGFYTASFGEMFFVINFFKILLPF